MWTKQEYHSFFKIINITNVFAFLTCMTGYFLSLLIAKDIILIVAGEKYLAATPIFTALLLAFAIYMLGLLLVPAFLAMGKTKTLLKANTIPTLIFLSTMPFFLHYFKVMGAAYLNIIFNILWVVIMYIGYFKTYNKAKNS